MTETIPQLSISTLPNGNLRLENEDPMGAQSYVLDLHPIQVRLMAERLGLVATSDVQAARRIQALSRRLWVLGSRIERLADYLVNCSDHAHADLSWEMTYCNATRDIADEFVADLDDEPSVESDSTPAPAHDVTQQSRVTPPREPVGEQLEIPA